jgi:hypothetical protein
MKNSTVTVHNKNKLQRSTNSLTFRERQCTMSDDEVEMQVSIFF